MASSSTIQHTSLCVPEPIVCLRFYLLSKVFYFIPSTWQLSFSVGNLVVSYTKSQTHTPQLTSPNSALPTKITSNKFVCLWGGTSEPNEMRPCDTTRKRSTKFHSLKNAGRDNAQLANAGPPKGWRDEISRLYSCDLDWPWPDDLDNTNLACVAKTNFLGQALHTDTGRCDRAPHSRVLVKQH